MIYNSKDISRARSVGMYSCGGPYLADNIEDARVEAWKNLKATDKCCIKKIIACNLDTGFRMLMTVETVYKRRGKAYTEKEKDLGTLHEFRPASGRIAGEKIIL